MAPLRVAVLALLPVVVLVTTLGGRVARPMALRKLVGLTTNGSFYHWRAFRSGVLRQEGWCAFRRSRTLTYRQGYVVGEERISPLGTFESRAGRSSLDLATAPGGMEVGNDFLTHEAVRISGLEGTIRPSREDASRYLTGDGKVYRLDSSRRIAGIEFPEGSDLIDYPAVVDSAMFEPSR